MVGMQDVIGAVLDTTCRGVGCDWSGYRTILVGMQDVIYLFECQTRLAECYIRLMGVSDVISRVSDDIGRNAGRDDWLECRT